MKEYLDVDSWKILMCYAETNIHPPSYIKVNTEGLQVGAYHRLDELAPKYLDRCLQALQLPPGNYEALLKMGGDGAIHRWYRWIYGPDHRGATPYLNIVLVGVFSQLVCTSDGLQVCLTLG